jgi:nucleoside-diphosphate-sugar epimerase
MTITLTGATGFVGRQILQSLLSGGHRVRVLVRDPSRLEPAAAGVEVRQTNDLFSEPPARLNGLLAGSHTLVHSAWYTEPGKYLESPLNLQCLAGTLRLAEAFVAQGGQRLVGVGTCLEYDQTAGSLSTRTPLAPTTVYAASKASAFYVLSNYLPAAGIAFAWCRLFYLYGEGEDDRRLVPAIRKALREDREIPLTEGRQVRDYMDVVVAGQEIAAIATGDTTGAVNICSGQPVTVREIAEKVADEFSKRHLLRFGALEPRLGDPPRIVGVR